jgi:type IV pilus assembly protein PilQ
MDQRKVISLVKKAIMTVMLCVISVFANTQSDAALVDRIEQIRVEYRSIDEPVDLNCEGMELNLLLNNLARTAKMNISIDGVLEEKVFASFSRISIAEVLMFLCKKYSLDVQLVNKIVYFKKKESPVQKRKEIIIETDPQSQLLTLDLKNDTLGLALKKFTSVSHINVQLEQGLYNTLVTSYSKDVTPGNALRMIATATNLKLTEIDSTEYLLEKREAIQAVAPSEKKVAVRSGDIEVRTTAQNILIKADKADLVELIKQVADRTQARYLFLDEIKGNVTMTGSFNSFDDFLSSALVNTAYSYHTEDLLYMIGNRSSEMIRSSSFFTFRSRSINGITDQIPAELKKGIEIKPFTDLNGFILTGSALAINELKHFLESLDKKVPVIDIEVYIVDLRDSRSVSTGIQAGLSPPSTNNTTEGSVYPSADVKLNSSAVNDIMNLITRIGLFSLGQVGPGFYLKLKLLEQQGELKIRSTPRLAALNGHEAKMSIGRTEYYLELQNNIIGTQNPQSLISQQYKAVNADLSLIITPVVSENDDVTMDIQVRQSNFTERISPSAPPGTISRDFQSMVRVKNGEMIVLGGLEEDTHGGNSEGLPVLSRIPVLKWIFSTRTRNKSKNKLTIFLKPTVIYQ